MLPTLHPIHSHLYNKYRREMLEKKKKEEKENGCQCFIIFNF